MEEEIIKHRLLLSHLIEEGEKDLAVESLISWAQAASYKLIIVNILEPVLQEWGKLWMEGKLSLAHGYLAGKVAEELFIKASQNQEFTCESIQKKGTIIIGNIEDDFHPLGRRLVSIFAQTSGWNIVDLGNDVMAENFVESALEKEARIIAASAMMFSTAKNIGKIRNILEKRSLSGKIQLAAGGAVFKLRPNLITEVGADGTAYNAIDAPALFNQLLMNSLKFQS